MSLQFLEEKKAYTVSKILKWEKKKEEKDIGYWWEQNLNKINVQT